MDVATKSARQVPFQATVRQTLTQALHFEYNPHPDSFAVKLMRDAATSPEGKWLVFSAVGSLWKKQLPDGAVSRLTRDNHNEYEPAFSPEGQWVVYTTFHDTTLGAIYKIRLRGGNPIRLTQKKGYYRSPVFSPDGGKIAFQRTAGNALSGFARDGEPGLYWMPAGGGLNKQYKNIGIDGKDERTIFILKYVNSIVPGPDEQWVAFPELFNANIAPFPKTGNAIDLNKDTKAIPAQRVTQDAGNYLLWSGDSRKLHWMIGAAYFTRDLRDTFSFVEGAADSIPGLDTTGLHIALKLESDVPSGTLALTGARLITMRGNEVIEDGTIVIVGNRITAVGPRDLVQRPSGAKTIDVSGKTIIPGLIDVHAHTMQFFSGPLPRQNWAYYANLAYGVTTNHDPSADTETVFTQSEMVRAGRMVGPRIFSTGTILYGADGDFKAVMNSLDDARSHLRRMKAVGAFSVKSYNQPRRNQRQQVIRAARELEMLVVPEGGATFFHNMTMI